MIVRVENARIKMTPKVKEGYHHTRRLTLLEGPWPSKAALTTAVGGEPYCGGCDFHPKLSEGVTSVTVTIWGCN